MTVFFEYKICNTFPPKFNIKKDKRFISAEIYNLKVTKMPLFAHSYVNNFLAVVEFNHIKKGLYILVVSDARESCFKHKYIYVGFCYCVLV